MIRRPIRSYRRLNLLLQAVLGLSMIIYLLFHSIEGERGLNAQTQILEQLTEAEAILTGLRMEKKRLAGRVILLRSDSLDRDMLEERAHALLNYLHPDEILIADYPPQPSDP